VSATRDRLRRTSIVLLVFASGFCNLVYEVVWARSLHLVFGVTVFAVSAVLTSFMLGLACGAILAGRFARRLGRPARTFAWLHVGISVAAIALMLVTPALGHLYVHVHAAFGANVHAARLMVFVLSSAMLVVPTTFMGATFPVSIEALGRGEPNVGKDIGTAYSASTLGSVIGCVTTVAVLLDLAGMRGTILIAAAADLAIGLLALAVDRFLPEPEAGA
jgi:spermidine synthase